MLSKYVNVMKGTRAVPSWAPITTLTPILWLVLKIMPLHSPFVVLTLLSTGPINKVGQQIGQINERHATKAHGIILLHHPTELSSLLMRR